MSDTNTQPTTQANTNLTPMGQTLIPAAVTDDSTVKRFKNLAIIGNFLFQISNDNAEQTDYFLAKSALTEFTNEVNLLNLDFATKTGVDNLIRYMDKKIEKRNRQAGGEFSKD